MTAWLCIVCILGICGMHSQVFGAFQSARLYISYIHTLQKSKRPHMFTEVNIYTLDYLSH